MDVLSRTEKQKIITSTIIASLFGAITLFVVMLLTSASQLSNGTGVQIGTIGPIQLFELFKNPISTGGYSAGLSFSPGLITYVLVWVGIGIVISAIRARYSYRKK
jgi:hypothetical protein